LCERGIRAGDIALGDEQAAARSMRWTAFGPCEIVWAELENGMPIVLLLESPGRRWSGIGITMRKR